MAYPIEMILLKQWASYMAIPIWISDADGNLAYYNEPAESILGVRFDEVGELPAQRLGELFSATGIDGEPLPDERRPIIIALTRHVPVHLPMRIKGWDGKWREIEVTAIPLIGVGGRHLGAMATFWERAET